MFIMKYRLLLVPLLGWAVAACSDGMAENTNARGVTPDSIQLSTEGRMPALEGCPRTAAGHEEVIVRCFAPLAASPGTSDRNSVPQKAK
jgi:hypothetical protein